MKRRANFQPGAAFKRPRQSPVVADVVMRDVAGQRRRRQAAPSLAVEKKFNDSSCVTDATTTASITPLNTMAAGDTALLRDGNKILCTSVQIRGTLTLESLAANAIVRYLVVHDKNSNGVDPTAAQIFSTTPAVYGLKSITNASRFTTLLDKTIVLMNQSDTAGAVGKAYINEYIKIPQALQLASFADGTSACPVSGSLSLIIISDLVAGAADVDVITLNRLRFIG